MKKSFVGWAVKDWRKYFKLSEGQSTPPMILAPKVYVPCIFRKEWKSYYKRVRITIEEI